MFAVTVELKCPHRRSAVWGQSMQTDKPDEASFQQASPHRRRTSDARAALLPHRSFHHGVRERLCQSWQMRMYLGEFLPKGPLQS